MHIARQLLSAGYLKQEGEFHTLSLTSRALEALRKRETILGIVQEEEREKKAGKKKSEIEYNNALFALLRQKRKELADEAGVPPYVIFSDRALIEMAAYYPQSVASLLKISGVGQVKLRQFGESFLEVIGEYCKKHGLEEIPRPDTSRQKEANGSSILPGKAESIDGELPERTRLVAEAFNQGETVVTLMERHRVTMGTILEHLTRYALTGLSLRNGEDLQLLSSVAPELKQAVSAAFQELGTAYLKPVYDKLNGTVKYDDLKILRLLYLIGR
jgi:ATP-dependent DNA helicase RecQ